jgi:SAM-dependent methyltransferase
MPADKRQFYHGWFYHHFIDPLEADSREQVVSIVVEGSSVLDIGCGTGELCFTLRAEKHCRVVGIDLSRRMLEIAERRNRYDDVKFLHCDAISLERFEHHSFDYATIVYMIHELPRKDRVQAVTEALRVADNVMLIDSVVPLPWNWYGTALRLAEAVGHSRDARFKNYLDDGGIDTILKDLDFPVTVLHRTVFTYGCRELVMIARKE